MDSLMGLLKNIRGGSMVKLYSIGGEHYVDVGIIPGPGVSEGGRLVARRADVVSGKPFAVMVAAGAFTGDGLPFSGDWRDEELDNLALDIGVMVCEKEGRDPAPYKVGGELRNNGRYAYPDKSLMTERERWLIRKGIASARALLESGGDEVASKRALEAFDRENPEPEG